MAESQDFSTIIGPDASFKGELKFESGAKVLGKIEGSIVSKGKVHVADGCDCKATIAAKDIAVEGHIEGNVEASDRLDVRPNGRITGDVVAAKMSMAEGAAIEGFLRIGVNGAAKGARQAEVKPTAQPATATTATAKAK